MAGELSRQALRLLAEEKAADAQLLVQNGRWSNGYYLFGYAIELGLKAIIARGFRAEEIPDRRRVESIYKHNLEELLKLSGLKEEFDQARADNPELATNWALVSQWSERSRYEIVDRDRAEDMAQAVTGRNNGLLEWLRTHW